MLFRAVDHHLQRELLETLAAGQGWLFNSAADDLDVNGDGRIDIDDAMQLAIENCDQWPVMLKEISRQAADARSDVELQELALVVRRIIHAALRIEGVVEQYREHLRRRKLRTTGVAGRGA
ncbi:hypothetical protein HED60_08805 [Planctomycetales bacterium ZRK34]|nr:hypothetical protein HED60_08805 [Planctomycetales bacterium ZRK34]